MKTRTIISSHKLILPECVRQLVNDVINEFDFIEPIPSIGFCCWSKDNKDNPFPDGWQIIFYPPAYEIIGGNQDGEIKIPGFYVNIKTILSHFSEVEFLVWRHTTEYTSDGDGPELIIQGRVGNENVRLRILGYKPTSEEVIYFLDAATNTIHLKKDASLN